MFCGQRRSFSHEITHKVPFDLNIRHSRASMRSRHTTTRDGGSAENAEAIFCLSVHGHSPLLRIHALAAFRPSMDIKKSRLEGRENQGGKVRQRCVLNAALTS